MISQMFGRILSLAALVVLSPFSASSHAAGTASVVLRPAYVDLSATTAPGAVLVSLSGYGAGTAPKYRLYNGSTQYNCWNPATGAFVTDTAYANGPLAPGDYVGGTQFWILFQRGNNNATAASYRDRLSPYSSNNNTAALPAATAISSPFTLTGTLTAGAGYDLSVRYVVLGFGATTGGTLLTAGYSEPTSGAFSLPCQGGQAVQRVEFRTISNAIVTAASRTGSWSSSTNLGAISLGGPSATQVRVETAANGSGAIAPAQDMAAGSSRTAYAVTRDAAGAFVANAAATWSLQSVSGGVVAGDLVAAGDGKSATFTAHSAGSAKIRATIAGLTSVDSGSITVPSVPTNPTVAGGSSSEVITGGATVVLTGTVTGGLNPGSTGITVTGDLGAIGGPAAVAFHDDGLAGDVSAGDGVFSFQATIPANPAGGSKTIPLQVADAQDRSGLGSIVLRVVGALAIYHVNDTHARLTPHKWIVPKHDTNLDPEFEDVGGAAFLAAKILQLTAADPDSLVLDAGDISEGNPIGDMNGNGSMTRFYALLANKLKAQRGRGMDAVVVGNHDVRDATYVANLMALNSPTDPEQTPVPVLSINVCAVGTHTPYFNPYTIVTVNGTRVGVLGYTTQAAEVGASLVPTLEVVDCDWSSTNAGKIHIADYVNQLRNTEHCDIVVLLAHIGHSALVDPDAPLLQDNAAALLPEVVISGHWHTWAESVWQPEILNYKTIFAESSSYMKYVGELRITSEGEYLSSAQHIVRNAGLTPDADVQAFVDSLEVQYAAQHGGQSIDEVVGYTADDLLLDNKMKWWSADEYPWNGNNTAGQWICDAMRWKTAQLFGACDIAIETGGGVRADIAAGPVTFVQVYETFPWSDDTFVRIQMTGQEILNFLKATNCNAGFSRGWEVTAFDGVPSRMTYNGQDIGLSTVYQVGINNYMYAHPPTGWTWADTTPEENSTLCRDGIVEFMRSQHGTPGTAYTVGGPRFHLNTEFSGGFRAVVTMMNDADSQPSYEDAFIRLLSATPETLARRGSPQVPVDLVDADGSVRADNRLSENELYRSFLGFKAGALRPGDIIETWGKGSFYRGTPEFVDQEGIFADGVEFKIVGHDSSLALPTYMPSIAAFWNDTHKNHYVKFLATKTGASTVSDQAGTSIKTWDVTAYADRTLPGNTGDLLLLTGLATMENYAMRFRCDSVVLASSAGITAYPPSSGITSRVDLLPAGTVRPSIDLTATASVADGSGTWTLAPVADAQVASGNPGSNYGTTTNLYVQSSASGYGNERGWLRFNLSSIPANATVTGATLRLYCWRAAGAAMPTELLGSSTDTWTETGITWSSQPALGNVLATQTLAAGTTNTWYTWDVTAFARSELAGDKLASFVVKPVSESSSASPAPSYAFDSKEYGSNGPELQITTTATGSSATVAQVQFHSRFSSNGTSWSGWTPVAADDTAPYATGFSFPQGYGYYEFYSIATDSLGNVQPTPIMAHAAVHYTAAPAYNTEAIVSLGNLSQTFDTGAHAVAVTTIPSGLATTVTYDGSTVPPTNAGNYPVVATVTSPGFSGSASGTLTIAKANQAIAFGPLPSPGAGSGSLTISATASSDLPVAFSSSNPGVATVSGNTLTILSGGNCTITASQSGDGNYFAAEPVEQILEVTFVPQTISFPAIGNRTVSQSPFTPTASASSGLPVTISVVSGPATVSGNSVALTGAGTVVLRASQGGDSVFAAATPVEQSFVVTGGGSGDPARAIPAAPVWAAILLAAGLATVAWRAARRNRRERVG